MSELTYNDFVLDCEALGSRPNSICVDISVVVFNPDPTVNQTFDELCASGKRFKLAIAPQKAAKRTVTKQTLEWWRDKPEDAKKHLLASPIDLTIEEAIPQLLQFLKDSGVDYKKSQMWTRGNSFDIPLFCDLIRDAYKVDHTNELEPVAFWNQRDIRTAIEAYSLIRGTIKTPLRKGALDGFVAHNSVHDCAKDVLMLKAAQRYTYGIEECPEADDIDPTTIPFKGF